ncbi:MAG: hypothetical protein KIH89_002035 [Candidatus Shapirobacteria bacterium]|nr:hypothetical protein [Candidatus Shapirobacteria bacterium]
MANNQNICCPEFDIKYWDNKTHVWQDKLFLKDEVKQIIHLPLNMGKVITRMWQKVDKAQAGPDTKDFLILAYDPSPWKSELYMTVTKNIPNANIAKVNGTFISKVFDGHYQSVPQWIQQMDKFLADQNQKAIKYYFHYAYCPKCAKKYGHNYCTAFAQIK